MNTQIRTNLYEEDGIVVRKSTKKDISYLCMNMRQSDIDEVWASNHLSPGEAVRKGCKNSVFCCTVENGNPIAMFGIVPESILGERASVWMLATDDLDSIKRRFAKHSRYFIEMMLDYYPYIYNHVDDRNKKSIEWLKFCGAKINKPEPYGVEGKNFRYFYFDRPRS